MTLSDWIAETRHRLDRWGFNSAGGWSLAPQQLRLPTVVNLEIGRNAKFHWFDPFAPGMEDRMTAAARAEKDSRLGHIPRLHIYPAARPVAACRAVICAALWPDPVDSLCPPTFAIASCALAS